MAFSDEYATLDEWIEKEGKKLASIEIYHDGSAGFFIAVWYDSKGKRYFNVGDTVGEAVDFLIWNSPLEQEAYP